MSEAPERDGRYRIVAETAADAIFTMDEESVILSANPAAERIFGWSVAELIGQRMTVLIPEALRGAHRAGVERYLASGRRNIPWTGVQLPGLHRSGAEIPLEISFGEFTENGRRVFTGIVRDISERRRFEQRLLVQYAVSRVLADAASARDAFEPLLQVIGTTLGWEVGTCWLVDAETNLMRCAAAWRRPGIDSAAFEAVGRRTRFARGVGLPGRVWERGESVWEEDVLGSDNFPRRESAAALGLHGALAFPVLRGRERVLGVLEFFTRERRGPDAALLQTVETIGNQVGQFLERKWAEEERARFYEAALAASRAKSDFLAVMSHELRTPLNAIKGYAQLLADEITGPVTARQREQLGRIQASADHLVALVEEVLMFSRTEAGAESLRPEHVDARTLVRDAAAVVEPLAAAKGLAFEVSSPDEGLAVETDPAKVRQVLLNLLANAVKFTERGRVTLAARADDGGVRLEVRDTGIGIKPEHLERIFEPFWQAHQGATRTAGGAGLGLSIARRLTTVLGGELTVASAVDEGSTFTLRIPPRPPGRRADDSGRPAA